MAGWRGILVMVMLLASACGGSTPAPAMPEEEFSKLTPAEAIEAERDALSRCADVTHDGYCGIRFGMGVDEARKAFPVEFEGSEVRDGADVSPDRCYELFAVAPVTGVSFLVEGGKVGRIDVLTEAIALGREAVQFSPDAIAGIRECVAAAGAEVTDDGLAVEDRVVRAVGKTDNAREGVAAFLEKRPAVFR